jgi:hypothetical protein
MMSRGTISKPLVVTERGGCADGDDGPRLNETCDCERHSSEEGRQKQRNQKKRASCWQVRAMLVSVSRAVATRMVTRAASGNAEQRASTFEAR